jgi:exosome complex component RRP41
VGYVPRTNEIVLLQMDGDLTPDEFTKGLNMAVGACKKVHEVQRDALKRRYSARAVDEAVPGPAEEQREVA